MSQSDDSDKSTSMTDREIYVEVGNLVFAGTGTTINVTQTQLLTMPIRRHNEYDTNISLLGIDAESCMAAMASGRAKLKVKSSQHRRYASTLPGSHGSTYS